MNKKLGYLGFICALYGVNHAMDYQADDLNYHPGKFDPCRARESSAVASASIDELIMSVTPLLKPWAATPYELTVMRQALRDQWQRLWHLAESNKKLSPFISDLHIKSRLFVAFANKIVAGKLFYLDSYNDDLVAIANQLGLKFVHAADVDYPAALAFIVQSTDGFNHSKNAIELLDFYINNLQGLDAQIRTLEKDKPVFYGYPETSQLHKNAFSIYKERLEKLLGFRSRTITIIKLFLDSGVELSDYQMQFLVNYGFRMKEGH